MKSILQYFRRPLLRPSLFLQFYIFTFQESHSPTDYTRPELDTGYFSYLHSFTDPNLDDTLLMFATFRWSYMYAFFGHNHDVPC